MKKKKVYRILKEIMNEIIDEIHEPNQDIELHISKPENKRDTFLGYQIGMSRAAIILMRKVEERFPETKTEDEA